jgi:hypothetical protein
LLNFLQWTGKCSPGDKWGYIDGTGKFVINPNSRKRDLF